MEPRELRPTKILLIFWIIGVVVACIPLGGIVAAFSSELGVEWNRAVAMGFSIPLVLITAYIVLYFHSIRYELDDRYITRASGVLWKKRRSIPFEKITNIDVRQGPVERLLGYGKIWIFTPSTGAATPEEKLVGVTSPHDMKQAIMNRTEVVKQGTEPLGQQRDSDSTGDIVSLLTDMRDSLKNIEIQLQEKKEKA